MKLKLLTITAATCCQLSAASISFGNIIASDASTIVVDSNGDAISSLVAQVFTAAAAPTSIAALQGLSFSDLGGGNLVSDPGAFSINNGSVADPITSGLNLYLVLSDNADLSLACHIGLIETQQTLDTVPSPGVDSNTFVLDQTETVGTQGVALLGEYSTDTETATWTNIFGGDTTGTTFVLESTKPVPEPSSAVLCGLAGLVVLRRRR